LPIGGLLLVPHLLALLLQSVDPLVVTFDDRLAEASRREGLAVVGAG